jgi:hypothetical protein
VWALKCKDDEYDISQVYYLSDKHTVAL